MTKSNSKDFDRLNFQSAIFSHYQRLSMMKESLAKIEAGGGMMPEPEGEEEWGRWLFRNVAVPPMDLITEWGLREYEKQPENQKRQKDAEDLLSNPAVKERFDFHLSHLPRKGLMEEEWVITVIKIAMVVLHDERPGSIDTTGTKASVIARVVWELINNRNI